MCILCIKMILIDTDCLLTQTEEAVMHVKNEGEKYVCKVCGNEVTVTKAGGGELVCCNEPMELDKD